MMNLSWTSIKPEAICLTAPYLIFRLSDPQNFMTSEDTENIETHLYELFIMNHSFSVDNIAHIIWSWKIWMITV